MNVQQYAQRAGNIFVLPDAVTRIKSLIDDDSADMSDIADLIQYDPALTAQLLKLANSALYKFPAPIDTLDKAVKIIGTKSVYDLVIAYGVASTFGNLESPREDLDKFWEKSVCCALFAKFLADALKVSEPERLFVSGLLFNIGELVVIQLDPQRAHQCCISNTPDSRSEQLKIFGFTFAEVGAALLRQWQLPEAIIKPIESQHFGFASSDSIDEKIMQAAVHLTEVNLSRQYSGDSIELNPEIIAPIKLDEDLIRSAEDYINLELMNILMMISPTSTIGY